MLLARATSELARLIASDAILGIGYSAEEVADGGSYEGDVAEVTTTPSAAPATRKMSRRKPAAEDGTPLRDEEGHKAAMFAAFNEAGFASDDRQARLDFCMATIQREIESSNDLTWDERSKILDALREMPIEAEVAQLAAGETAGGAE
jgi:hypothetical protein